MSSKAIILARELAKKYNLTPPVDVKSLIEKMDVTLEVTRLESMSGFAYQKGNKRVIGVNKEDGDLRQKFTMAHELGHMFVHAQDDVMFDRDFVYFRDDNSSTGLHPKEVEANAFAAELLMPAEKLAKQIIAEGGIDPITDDEKIKELAQEYGVSCSAMSVRIDSLTRHGVK